MVGAALGTSTYQVLFSANESPDLPERDYDSIPMKKLHTVEIDNVTELKDC